MSRWGSVAIGSFILLLSGCGAQADLQPQAGAALPPAPIGRNDRPTAKELLKVPDQAKPPRRSEELRTRSEELEDDPFDLPPS